VNQSAAGSWVMERKMLLTIKQRAERLARTQATIRQGTVW
jgi:hypothetical protein